MNKLESMHRRLKSMEKKNWLFRNVGEQDEINELRNKIKEVEEE